MTTISAFNTASGTCWVRTEPYGHGWRIFSRDRDCGWVAPPGIPAGEPTTAKATNFTRPKPRGQELNDVLRANDLVAPTDLPPRWKTEYDNHPARRG